MLSGRGRSIPWQHYRRIQGALSRGNHVPPESFHVADEARPPKMGWLRGFGRVGGPKTQAAPRCSSVGTPHHKGGAASNLQLGPALNVSICSGLQVISLPEHPRTASQSETNHADIDPPVSPLRRSRPALQHPACSPFDERWMGWVPNSDSDATATREETPDKMNGHGMDASVKAASAIRLLIAMHI